MTAAALATKETIVVPFNITKGMTPLSGLIADKAGNLYGVTSIGGNGDCSDFGGGSGCGTVYKLIAPATNGGAWTEAVLYNFQGGADGDEVVGSLIFDKSGNLYGTTGLGGGGGCTYGCGTVFELSPPTTKGGSWTKSTLYTFQGGNTDAAYPAAALVFDAKGNLYGSSEFGGNANCGGFGCGTIFELSPPPQPGGAWTEAVLHTFVGPTTLDAYSPSSNLIFDAAGNLYGTAGFGGDSNNGAIFEMTPPATQGDPWSEAVIYSFIGPPDGASPSAGLVLAPSGVFYGTATGWGPNLAGTVFALAPPAEAGGAWTVTVLHAFTLLTDGGNPGSSVVLDAAGNLYGTTAVGGNYSCNAGFDDGCGVAFQLAVPTKKGGAWKETVLHSFTGGHDGIQPEAGLVFGKFGLLYGTTETGGVAGAGTVFSVVK
jgi:uncharacterized repeat protein (TIGR03803 family)